MSLIVKVWLKSLAYPSGEKGGKSLVQMISTCLRYTQRRGGGDPRPVVSLEKDYKSDIPEIPGWTSKTYIIAGHFSVLPPVSESGGGGGGSEGW